MGRLKKETAASDAESTVTPMMLQYNTIRDEYPDCILFYRLGDFYEMFGEQATTISNELSLTLTSKGNTPMCGVPYHAANSYIKRLLKKGFKIAVAEQVGDPKEKGLTERAVIRVITTGTVIEDNLLDSDKNNYITAFFYDKEKSICSFAFSDVSTGELLYGDRTSNSADLLEKQLISELSAYSPTEILFNSDFLDFKKIAEFLKSKNQEVTGSCYDLEFSEENLNSLISQTQIKPESLSEISSGAKNAIEKLLFCISRNNPGSISRFIELLPIANDVELKINSSAKRNLEIFENLSGDNSATLFSVLDKTKTPAGKRMLRKFLERPLTDILAVNERLDVVEELMGYIAATEKIRSILSETADLNRIVTRIVTGNKTGRLCSPRDIAALALTLDKLPDLKIVLSNLKSPLFSAFNTQINEENELCSLLINAIEPAPPVDLKNGGAIKCGFSEELDYILNIKNNANEALENLEAKERELTGIKNLKVSFNRVFGYYIEISRAGLPHVPERYFRKQTLANGERFITDELKNLEVDILTADAKVIAAEELILKSLTTEIEHHIKSISRTAEALANIDALCSFAVVSVENNYTKPLLSLDNVLDVKEGRHPVIEKILRKSGDTPFVPNDLNLNSDGTSMVILTGPNMSGKSTYMRQTALIAIMAQSGCFVPASYCRLGMFDRIFTRIGASDDLAGGKSTFMVEMAETAEILNEATNKSLVILDEIGRGTSTFDGISIAKSVAEYIAAVGCRSLFATHYHELTALEKYVACVKNFSVSVKRQKTENGYEIKFFHKIIEGGTDKSYGIEVAKIAGVPDKVLRAARKNLSEFEKNGTALLNDSSQDDDDDDQIKLDL